MARPTFQIKEVVQTEGGHIDMDSALSGCHCDSAAVERLESLAGLVRIAR